MEFQIAPNDSLRNPWYPLPADYPELTAEGQRQARVAAVSRRKTPQEFVESWALFRQLYLMPLPPGAFYPTGALPSPTAHYEWIHDFEAYSRNAIGAPRASAKSTILGKELPLLNALTRPYYTQLIVLANDRMVEQRFEDLALQLTENELILEDFGKQKPRKGEMIWNRHQMTLDSNRSSLIGLSVESRKLGHRPSAIILDDPEYNPDIEGSQTAFLDNMERFIFREMLPMLEDHCGFMWIGTLLSRRSALWQVCMGDDERFDFWNRRIYSMVGYDDHGIAKYFWEEKWDADAVARKRKELGAAAFESECQNNPVSTMDRTLTLDPIANGYTIAGDTLSWQTVETDGTVHRFETSFSEWLEKVSIVAVVDPAAKVTATSDYSAIGVIAIDEEKNWWVLELSLKRIVDQRLLDEVYKLGSKWGAALVGFESIAFQDQLRNRMQADVLEKSDTTSWEPRVFPIRSPAKLSKPERIANVLGPRLSRGKIRLPLHLKDVWPYKELFRQIEDFTKDLKLLPHDDAVDMLSLMGYVPVPNVRMLTRLAEGMSIEDQIAAGRIIEESTGLPLIFFIDPSSVDAEALRQRRNHEGSHPYHTLKSVREKKFEKSSTLTRRRDIMRGRRRN